MTNQSCKSESARLVIVSDVRSFRWGHALLLALGVDRDDLSGDPDVLEGEDRGGGDVDFPPLETVLGRAGGRDRPAVSSRTTVDRQQRVDETISRLQALDLTGDCGAPDLRFLLTRVHVCPFRDVVPDRPR
jgi:hypothetical protein